MSRNLKLTLSYDGSEFHGWQVQPGMRTVQGTLQEALTRVSGTPDLPQGSGRTDAGVHAFGQVVSWATESPIPAANLVKAMNDLLPPSIRVLAAEEVAADFHARRSAKRKTYRYRIYRGNICPPFLARYVYHHPFPLNEDAMIDAGPLVEGEHDFTSFAAVDPDRSVRSAADQGDAGEGDEPLSNVRTIYESRWENDREELVYTVRGSGFLHHMVRNLVGTFLLLGKGTLTQRDLRRILELRDRSAAGPTAPASGLCLVSVEY
jgi:tRNA pseudouridine38-40 synthase